MTLDNRPFITTLDMAYSDGSSPVRVPLLDFQATVQDPAEGGSTARVVVARDELSRIGDRRHMTITGHRMNGDTLEGSRVIFTGEAGEVTTKEEEDVRGEVRDILILRSRDQTQDYGTPEEGEVEGYPQDGDADEELIIGVNVSLRPGDGAIHRRNPGEASEQATKCNVRRQEWGPSGATETVTGEPCENKTEPV